MQDDDWPTYQLARDHFRACMDKEGREEAGVRPMLEALEPVGGWPVLEEEEEGGRRYPQWWQLEERLVETGLTAGHIVSLGVVIDARYADRHVLRLSPPKLGLSNKALLKGSAHETTVHYLRKMVRAAVAFGAPEERARREMSRALDFERELARVQEEVKEVEKVRAKRELLAKVNSCLKMI